MPLGTNLSSTEGNHFPRRAPKPEGVRNRVTSFEALMPQAGCRTIAYAFNRLHERKGITVSKSYGKPQGICRDNKAIFTDSQEISGEYRNTP